MGAQLRPGEIGCARCPPLQVAVSGPLATCDDVEGQQIRCGNSDENNSIPTLCVAPFLPLLFRDYAHVKHEVQLQGSHGQFTHLASSE